MILATSPVGSLAQEATPSSAAADVEAQALFQAGSAAFAEGRYEEALERFQRAHELSPRPELLYNIAVCADRLRQDARALDAFRRYLAAAPESDRRREIEVRIRILEAELAERARGMSESGSSEPQVGAPESPRPQGGPTEPTSVERSSPSSPSRGDAAGRALAIVGGTVAGLGLVTALVVGPLALSTDASLTSSCSPACPPERVGELQSLAVATDVSLGIALVGAAVLGIGLALDLGGGSGSEQRDIEVVWAPRGDGGGLAVRGRLP